MSDVAQLATSQDAAAIARHAIAQAARSALRALQVPLPIRASEWADRHFYLSAESSYTQDRWQCWPFQRAILDCMGNDGIPKVVFRKSARVGYSKMMLACVGYYAQHRRRNQVVYQPTDFDAKDWVKTELDTMLRDVRVMRDVFPASLQRSKENTLEAKTFLGSRMHVRGGKAAKNFRRLTVDVVYLDELDGFDRDIEKEGSPTKLSLKRLEGATFPKHISGSTPKLRGFSLIDEEHDSCELQFRFHVPCPHCGHEQPLEWGGKQAAHGFKWTDGAPDTVVHICARCGVGFSQPEYLKVWQRGRWVAPGGVWIDAQCRFRVPDGSERPPPQSVGFSVWTAYSPQASWADIVAEYLEAIELKKKGDATALKTWTNTTLGQSYKLEGESSNADQLRARAKEFPYRLRLVPRAALLLTAGVDVQDNRFHVNVWGFGREDQSWLIDRRVIYCNPGQWASWMQLDAYLGTRFPHEAGQTCAIEATAIDTGGHFTHAVYRYAMMRESRRVHATKGSSQDGKQIVAGTPSRQDVNVDGQVVRDGVRLWHVGTDTAKDLLHTLLRNSRPGPGFVHISPEVESEFFDQLTAEQRLLQKTSRGLVHRWVKPNAHTRNEDLDCTVLALFCAARLRISQYTDAEWTALEQVLCPRTRDLFAAPPVEPLPLPAPQAPEPAAATPPQPLQTPAPALWAPPRVRRVRGCIE